MPRNPQKERIGVITAKGTVRTDDGRTYHIQQKGIDNEGYPEVLIDAEAVGGKGWLFRQSIKPYIGMKCLFIGNDTGHGYNFRIIN